MEDVIAIVLIFGGGTVVALALSPIGRAIAARIQHGPGRRDDDEVRQLRESHQAVADELEAVRQDVVELQERVDFAERRLARHKDDPRLPGAGP
jgi:hypothetical protein